MLSAENNEVVKALAETLSLGAVLDRLRDHHSGYDLIEHWTQGEFHHDVVLRVNALNGLPGPVSQSPKKFRWGANALVSTVLWRVEGAWFAANGLVFGHRPPQIYA